MDPERGAEREPLRTLGVAAGLAVLAAAVYAPSVGFDFVNFDDHAYVKENARVLAGLTWPGVGWALTTHAAANWHPLTWLSLMLDTTLSGPGPAGYHIGNVVLHALSTALLFLAFRTLTQATWKSAFVAALFAVHPLHVESVAWIAERKDVLSGVFFMLSLLAYAGWVRRRSRGRYVMLLAAFAAGLMAKPMLVSLPLVLLVLDFWPLGRFAPPPDAKPRRSVVFGLLIEKVPLAVLAAASCVVTLRAQAAGGAVTGADVLPFGSRVANALVACTGYLAKTVWPARLAVLYPHPRGTLGAFDVVASLVVLLGIGALAYGFRERRPALAAGWAWYLIMLIPVIGLVQVGSQSMADRYTYLPLVGVFAAVAWSLPDLEGRRATALALAGATVVAVLCVVTRAQLAHWRDGASLFEHAIRVTGPNARAQDGLGTALVAAGRVDLALGRFEEALRIDPAYGGARCNLAAGLAKTGAPDAAMAQFVEALRHAPADAACHANFGSLLLKQRDLGRAQVELEEAVRLAPENVSALKNLGVALAMQGKMADAVARFEEALRIDPRNEEVRRNLERAKSRLGGTP